MNRSQQQLREDAESIWRAGVQAVQSDRLVKQYVRVEGDQLWIGDDPLPLGDVGRIVVVGAGKAGAGMAAGLEQALGEQLISDKQLSGWINVPEDCLRETGRIHLHGARPAGVNEPTPAGVEGAERILELVSGLKSDDLCLCLISGGGSALLPAPVDGISLEDKLAVTKFLSGAGANIEQLNTVRKPLSRIKGGRLAKACRAGRLYSLIISDVIGDPLDVIASGPTVQDTATPQDALDVLHQFEAREAGIPSSVFDYLAAASSETKQRASAPPTCKVSNVIIGNNATAVDAAGMEAERRGYSHAMSTAVELEGYAEDVGRHLADMATRMRWQAGPDCLITGGEPTVKLVEASQRGRGGRNQQLVLAALEHLLRARPTDALEGIAMLAGGTDGEDGPTDAAGAVIDSAVVEAMRQQQLKPSDYLRRNDAYNFFRPLDALIQTGPTHTNVCDLRVVVVQQSGKSSKFQVPSSTFQVDTE